MKWQHVIGQNGDVKGCQLKSNNYEKVSGLGNCRDDREMTSFGQQLQNKKIVISSFRIKVKMQRYIEDSLSPVV